MSYESAKLKEAETAVFELNNVAMDLANAAEYLRRLEGAAVRALQLLEEGNVAKAYFHLKVEVASELISDPFEVQEQGRKLGERYTFE